MCSNHLETIPLLPLTPVCGKIVFHETGPWCQKGWGASLVAQWLRIHLPTQGTRVRALGRKIPHAVEQLSPCTTATEARVPRARAPQQEKPRQ